LRQNERAGDHDGLVKLRGRDRTVEADGGGLAELAGEVRRTAAVLVWRGAVLIFVEQFTRGAVLTAETTGLWARVSV